MWYQNLILSLKAYAHSFEEQQEEVATKVNVETKRALTGTKTSQGFSSYYRNTNEFQFICPQFSVYFNDNRINFIVLYYCLFKRYHQKVTR